MNHSRVVSIFITETAGAPMRLVSEVKAVSGKGLEGDRYFDGDGTFSRKSGPDREVTLIELEAVKALERDYQLFVDPGDTRRNIVTKGIALNHLVGKEFKVGQALLRGIKLCEPCGHMEKLSKAGAKQGLIHRGGLLAQILETGSIRIGDEVRVP